MVYFIESGQVKLLMLSSDGKECILAIHASGDVFGELCLSGLAGRLETATVMEDTLLKKVPCTKFLERLARDSQLEGFVKGKKGPRSTRIELRISHEELSNMIATTRPRISVFMRRFRNLGLIELSEEHYLVINENKLTAYLTSIA